MKKAFLLFMCVLLMLLCGCRADRNGPDGSTQSVITQSLSLLDQMVRSDAYFSLYGMNRPEAYAPILEEIRSVPDLTKPSAVYRIEISEERLMPLVLKGEPELPKELKEYVEKNMNGSITSLVNAKKGVDYMIVHTAFSAKAGGVCPDEKEGSILLSVYETGYPVLTIVRMLQDSYVEASSTFLFLDVTSENSNAEIKEMLADALSPFFESVHPVR